MTLREIERETEMVSPISLLEKAAGPNTCQWIANSVDRGDFLIQLAWPLAWSTEGAPPENDPEPHIIVVLDGNAYFWTAVDISRRMEYLDSKRTVVVGIGYPNDKAVYDFRRGPDLTPASPDGDYEMPLDKNGKPRTDISFGKAKEFLDFIQHEVMHQVFETLLPSSGLNQGRKALFGHSYGGIFALHVLFTAPQMFDTFIAASPIIWWNRSFLVNVEEPEFMVRKDNIETPPSLLLTHGGCKKDVTKRPEEPQKVYERRCSAGEDDQMKYAVQTLASRLKGCPKMGTILTREFHGEDHGSAAVTGLQAGIMDFLRRVI